MPRISLTGGLFEVRRRFKRKKKKKETLNDKTWWISPLERRITPPDTGFGIWRNFGLWLAARIEAVIINSEIRLKNKLQSNECSKNLYAIRKQPQFTSFNNRYTSISFFFFFFTKVYVVNINIINCQIGYNFGNLHIRRKKK